MLASWARSSGPKAGLSRRRLRLRREPPLPPHPSSGLPREAERKPLQEAIAGYGVYDGAIDGAFGPGTRKSMQAWQEAAGFEATGVLTTKQRGTLLANYQADKAEFGFETITEAEAGIEITLPMGLTADGLPVGLSFIGYKWNDHLVLKAGHAYELLAGVTIRPTLNEAPNP